MRDSIFYKSVYTSMFYFLSLSNFLFNSEFLLQRELYTFRAAHFFFFNFEVVTILNCINNTMSIIIRIVNIVSFRVSRILIIFIVLISLLNRICRFCGMLLICDKKNELLRDADSETSYVAQNCDESNLIYRANPIGQESRMCVTIYMVERVSFAPSAG